MKKPYAVSIVLAVMVLATAVTTGCGTTTTTTPSVHTTVPSTGATIKHTPQEQLIYDYYKAINDKTYETAWAMTTANFKAHRASFAAFQASYADYVKSVKVVSVKKLPEFSTPQREEYDTSYDATYIKLYPAGSGHLPTVNVVVPDPSHPNRWLLDEIGTG